MNHSHPDHTREFHEGNSISRLIISLALNLIIFLVELIAGIFAHSLALISDSMHNLSDFSAIIIILGANTLSLKKPTYTKSFGFKRAETIGALLNVALLIGVAIFLFWEGIVRIRHPQAVSGSIMIWVSVVGLIANSIAVVLLHHDASHDLGLKSVCIHLMADAISSLGIIITGIIVHFTHNYILDPILSLGLALFILWNCWGILKEAVNILLEGVPANIDLQHLKMRLEEIDQILDVHHIHVWGISSRHISASLHILLKDNTLSEVEKVMTEVRRVFHQEFHIDHVTIQPETQKYEEVSTLCQRL